MKWKYLLFHKLSVTPTLAPLLSPVAPNFQICGGTFTGDLPECQIQATDEPVQFFTASDNGDLANDFGSLEWRIDDVFPGAGSSVSSLLVLLTQIEVS